MNIPCCSRRSKLFVALALCGIALMTFPQKAQAFGFPMCPFKKNDALCSAVKVIGQSTELEITNVIAGNAIGALSQLGFELRLSLPSTVSADDQVRSFKFDWTAHYEIQNPLGAYLLSVGLNLK